MAFQSFTNIFSNSPIQPTYQSYLALDFTSVTSVQLEWPIVNPNTETPYAQTIQVTVNASATNKIILPDATMATQGQTNTIVNSGASTILVYAFGGTTLKATIAPSQQWLMTLTDNTTSDGQWLPLQLAATTSAATAVELIDTSPDTNGHINSGGLAAFPTNYIKQNLVINKVLVGSTYTQASGDRGMILVWESGTGIYTCDSAADLGNGFPFTVINNSTVGGQLTIAPATGDTINGGTIPFVLNPGNSSSFSSDGTSTIYSFASSQSQTDIVTLVDINLSSAVGTSITLTASEANYSIQKFIGTGTSSPLSVIYPNNIINEWIAHNASGTTSIVVSLFGSSTVNYLIPPGNRLSLYSDGTYLYNTPNFLDDTTIYLTDGSVTTPSLTFSNDNDTGLYRPESGFYTDALAVTQSGTATMYFQNTVNTSVVNMAFPDGSASTPSLTFSNDYTTGLFRESFGSFTGSLAIAQDGLTTMYFDNTQNSSLVNLGLPDGSTNQPSLFFLDSDDSGMHLTTSGDYTGALTLGQNATDLLYLLNSGNTVVNGSGVNGPALDTLQGSYRDQGISIYSLMRAYG